MDFFSDELRRNPYPAYDQLRRVAPIAHNPAAACWMILDYECARAALKDSDTFSSSLATSIARPTPQWFIFFDPPRHTRLRGLIMRAFTPKMVAGLEPRIRDLSAELLDAVVDRGEMDLATDFAVPLPMMVIAGMIGIPAEDWARFRRWSDSILKLSYTLTAGAVATAATQEYFAVTAEMKAWLPALIDQRRASPGDDLLTNLVHAELDGERLTEDEILAFVQLLLIAGNETTSNLINNAVLSFIENPEQMARLRRTPELLPWAIEEVLRYRSPLQWVFRGTTRDFEFRGHTIPAGQLVLVMLGAANRDPAQFAEPDRFDITRDPNPHLAFGHGIHFCVGAPLSRMEARIALGDLLQRTDNLELASTKPWEPRKALHVLGPASLPVRFQPGRGLAAQA
ncbi:MAG TPA: cytochrome P450 [Bryobacteraceae bacterium]|nr:cytochrome P450 [Bryobacteraceae bacterium]